MVVLYNIKVTDWKSNTAMLLSLVRDGHYKPVFVELAKIDSFNIPALFYSILICTQNLKCNKLIIMLGNLFRPPALHTLLLSK